MDEFTLKRLLAAAERLKNEDLRGEHGDTRLYAGSRFVADLTGARISKNLVDDILTLLELAPQALTEIQGPFWPRIEQR